MIFYRSIPLFRKPSFRRRYDVAQLYSSTSLWSCKPKMHFTRSIQNQPAKFKKMAPNMLFQTLLGGFACYTIRQILERMRKCFTTTNEHHEEIQTSQHPSKDRISDNYMPHTSRWYRSWPEHHDTASFLRTMSYTTTWRDLSKQLTTDRQEACSSPNSDKWLVQKVWSPQFLMTRSSVKANHELILG